MKKQTKKKGKAVALSLAMAVALSLPMGAWGQGLFGGSGDRVTKGCLGEETVVLRKALSRTKPLGTTTTAPLHTRPLGITMKATSRIRLLAITRQ